MPNWLLFGILVTVFGALFEVYTREKRRKRIEDDHEPDDAIGRWLHDDGERYPPRKDTDKKDGDAKKDESGK